jgi:hypothetical protein
MADQNPIGIVVESQIRAARKGRHAQDRPRQVGCGDAAGFHELPPESDL